MTSRPSDFIRNLGSSVSQLVDPDEREEMVRTAARAAVEGVAEEIDSIGPELKESVPALVADTAEQATGAAVRGALRELRGTFPDFHDTLGEVRAALAQYIEEHRLAAENGEPGPRMQRMAEGAVRGAATEVRKLVPELAAELRRLGTEDGPEALAALELGVEVVGRKLVAGAALELRDRTSAIDGGALIQEASRAVVAGAIDGLVSGVRKASGGLARWGVPAALLGVSTVVAAAIVVRGR